MGLERVVIRDRYEEIAEDILAKLYDIHPPQPVPQEVTDDSPAQTDSWTDKDLIIDIPPLWEHRQH